MARSFSAPLAGFSLLALLSFVAGCNGDEGADFYESCAAASECTAAAEDCFVIAWEGASATGAMCSQHCEVHEDCPTTAGSRMGASCWELDGDPMVGQRVCYQRCASAADCPTGFLCADADIGGTIVDSICLPR